MSTYRRAYLPGGTFFLTVVSYNRTPMFADSLHISLLRNALRQVKQELPFQIAADCILPDHLHFLWTLPPADADFSTRVGRFKVLFTKAVCRQQRTSSTVSESRLHHRESDVWQRRFWEHTIRDERDFQQHLEYIHYNPVKHGLATCPHQWAYSSFARWVKSGEYTKDWGCVCDGKPTKIPDFTSIEDEVGE